MTKKIPAAYNRIIFSVFDLITIEDMPDTDCTLTSVSDFCIITEDNNRYEEFEDISKETYIPWYYAGDIRCFL